jgi:hypothetical protein
VSPSVARPFGARVRAFAGQAGTAAIELSAGVALLVLPIALLVLSLPQWPSRQAIARLAARDAARAVSLRGWCDTGAGDRVVAAIATGASLPSGALRVSLDCAPDAPLPRGASVSAAASVEMPALTVPLIGTLAAWTWTAVHREPVDRYGSRP